MATQSTVYAKELSSWTPDIDNRRQGKPGIITGTNFIDDVDGPRSAFSNSFNDYNLFNTITRQKVSELRLVNEILYGTVTGIYRINKTSKILECLLAVDCSAKVFWPWTYAMVGGVYYFAQYDIGLWRYDPITETISHVVVPIGDKIRGVAVSYGRLIYIGVDGNGNAWVGDSDLDDGTALTPDLQHGIVAQAISMVGGDPLKIVAVEGGFFVFTTEGILQASITTEAYVFYYRPRTDKIKIFSPNAAIYVQSIGAICLDATGFHKIPNAVNAYELVMPEPWEILMGDYLKKNVIANLDQSLIGNINLYYSNSEQRLFVSFSSNIGEGFLANTYVFNVVAQKWSSFDTPHYGMFEVLQSNSRIFTCGFMGIDGYIRKFTNTNYTDTFPVLPNVINDFIFRAALAEQPVKSYINISNVSYLIGYTELNCSDFAPSLYSNYSEPRLYDIATINYTDPVDHSIDYDPVITSDYV